ncbi:MAG: hypothetical protein ACXAEJ_05160 [Candidatus Thorarchaeota archaeon]
MILDAGRMPTPVTKDSVVGHLINSFSGRDVRDVFVDGIHVVKGAKMVITSDKEISRISRTSADKLWTRLSK